MLRTKSSAMDFFHLVANILQDRKQWIMSGLCTQGAYLRVSVSREIPVSNRSA